MTAASMEKFSSSFGYPLKTGDMANMANAVIRYVNTHGGAAGREMVPVFYDVNVARALQDGPSEQEAACTAFTQDDRVYAVATPISLPGDGLYACLSKHHVITSAVGEMKDARFFRRFADYLYMPVEINVTRMLSTNIDALVAAGFFGRGAKIAFLRNDSDRDRNAATDGLLPALARHGLKLADEFAISDSPSNWSAEYSSAVLRFKSNDITHILFTSTSPVLFGSAAESQEYRPLYALHSRLSPGAKLEGQLPAAQLHGSMGIGWQPMNDMNGENDPGKISDRQQLCLKLMNDAGEDMSSRTTALTGLWICDAIFFLDDVIDRAPNFTPAGFRVAAEGLNRNQAASTFVSSFARGRTHDGAQAYRLFAFKDDCSCFSYVTPVLRTRV